MGRNKDELIKLAEKITGQECKDVLTKKDALKKIACYYLGEEKEFASIADCLESIVEHGASGGSGGGDFICAYKMYVGRGYCYWVCSSKDMASVHYIGNNGSGDFVIQDSHCVAGSGIEVTNVTVTFTDGQTVELNTIIELPS